MTTPEQVTQWFEELHKTDYLDSDRIDSPMHPRKDIAALLLVHKIMGGDRPMITAATYDKIYLNATVDQVAAAGITREQVLELTRYGVRIDDNNLSMYV